MKRVMEDAVRALQLALDLHEPGEQAHAERVAVYAVATAERMGFTDEDLQHLRRAAQLHDVGKIAVDRAVLRKMGQLTDEDFASLKKHADAAVDVLQAFDWMQPAVPMIRHHHERWDGQGYPSQLAGEDIPLGARVLAVAEAFDAMTTGTPWSQAMKPDEAVSELQTCAGTQFDPKVVDAFAAVQSVIQPVGLA